MLILRFKLLSMRIIALTALVLLTACTVTPRAFTKAKPAYAPRPAKGGILAEVETGLQARHGKELSGFRLLDSNADGLEWRLAVIDSAQQSLDLQYYLWYGDQSGLLLMNRTIAAANRGVKVRILIDDLDTILRDAATPELRDHPFAAINSHPNIEIRLFNPWNARMLLGRAYELLIEMERLNQRMHNKLMVADNRAAIIGGRNLGDEYLGLNSNFNFHDLDVLGVGPVARQSSAIFDRFWNSEWVMPVAALQEPLGDYEVETLRSQMRDELRESAALAGTPLDPVDWSASWRAFAGEMSVGTSRTFTDSPDEDAVVHHMPDAIRDLLATADTELLITNAYIIPEQNFVERLAEMQEEMLWVCEAAHIPVVWATQVLETFVRKGTPSRAEMTDAAMSERAECVMLNKGPHILAAIAAACHVQLGANARIVSITSGSDTKQVWSLEGRRQIFASHQVR